MNKNFHRLLRIPYYLQYYYYKYFFHDQNGITKIQNSLYSKLGFSRELGYSTINTLCLELFNEAYDEDNGMHSEHLILFACLSIHHKFANQIKEILEIGTYDGKTALILARLFPNAKITTIDLRDDSEELYNTYGRANYISDFILKRNLLLGKGCNIQFIQMNSLNLLNISDNKYDLIWIDGAHGYPIITSDIINSLRLTRIGAHILVDDVLIKNKSNDSIYRSTGAYETLLSLKKANLISKFFLINKRLTPKYNFRPKYVAYFRKEQHE